MVNPELCPLCNKGQMRTHKKVVEEADQSIWEKIEINQLVCDKCGHVIEDSLEFKLRSS